MNTVTFRGRDMAEVVEQARQEFGPDALVVDVRLVRPRGLTRWWRRSRVELVAAAPTDAASGSMPPAPSSPRPVLAPSSVPASPHPPVDPSRSSLASTVTPNAVPLVQSDPWGSLGAARFGGGPSLRAAASASGASASVAAVLDRLRRPADGGTEVGAGATAGITGRGVETAGAAERYGGGRWSWHWEVLVERVGLLPVLAETVLEAHRVRHGEEVSANWAEELRRLEATLMGMRAGDDEGGEGRGEAGQGGVIHVFVGAPGVGKTTVLAKWLTRHVLGGEGAGGAGRARVWRLDGVSSNTGSSLGVYCEALGVPEHRLWRDGDGVEAGETGFVDWPGVPVGEMGQLEEMRGRLGGMGRVRVHLVLNGGYRTALWFSQVKAYAGLGVEDLVVTHLDEESMRARLWNLVLGTNYSPVYVAGGKNVPGWLRRVTMADLAILPLA